ncbi:hypothetical protein ACFQZS_15030 [Mucilaginibacter calamicampi]|uniref:Outer membrane protein beta-barrel domain-containing protein n=1 Tax=Mucilaginibacter calamicampi TaxID=1302352 RepID=A0ABW2YYB1_9SPHI
MKYFFSLFLITAICFNLRAQTNFKPGYVVTLNGDTTKGFIDYKQWGHRNPTHVTFKAPGGDEKSYGVNDINAFGIDSYENYRALTVSLSQNTLAVSDLTNNIDSSVIIQKVFLRTIVTGEKVSLFVYEDFFKNRCYIAEGTAAPVELLRYKYMGPTGNSKIIEVETFRQQLQRLAAIYQTGNANLSRQIQEVFYGEQDFKTIIAKINGTAAVKYIEPKRSSIRYFAGLGLSANEVHFVGSLYQPMGKQWSYSPQLNLGMDILSNKQVPKLFLRLELNAWTSRAKYIFYSFVAPTNYEQEFSYSAFNLNLTPLLVYNVYRGEKLKFFLAAGPSWFYSFYSNKVSVLRGIENNKITSTSQGPIGVGLKNGGMPIATRIGVTTVKFQFFGGYSLPGRLLGPAKYSLQSTTYSLGVNYFFSNK